ncbi:MAG: phosphoenolpyruvate carboxykinase (ATP) [Candidatus Eisenbacteria bacterium]|nr:phosphoenolpyruvate carboxykinase (ATP) [Candidatus Eisenbacteria bacterium]
MTFSERLKSVMDAHGNVKRNISRAEMIREGVEHRECVPAACGALATWTPPESSGRSPKDTYIVRNPESEATIDWTSPNNIPLDPDTFDMLLEDSLAALESSDRMYVTDRLVGANSSYSLPVHTLSDWALSALFTDNVFRPWSDETAKSTCFSDRHFTLLALPYRKLDPARYEGRLRVDPGLGHTSTMAVAMNFDRGLGVVYGSAYGGSIKKLIFTVMNYLLPGEDILPLHCSANEGKRGDCALLLGLSGTGKTTLSADPSRALLGDDEHGWNDEGIANFENGCYAKLIDLDPEKEPEIYNACFHKDDVESHGAIIENAMMYPWGEFDLFDDRLTPNSRGSYPLTYLSNTKEGSSSGHPKTILFLTADANGVIPPVAKLSREQAMFWFLMGYTSKLAGTETGIVDPVSTFSRFFGEPFMPRLPEVYASMLGEKMDRHGTSVYLVNTGWTGGPYGVGHRISLPLTRRIVNAALEGKLEDVEYERDPIFKVDVPTTCPGVEDTSILKPVNTWNEPAAYEERARKLAGEFAAHYEKAYGDQEIDPAVAAECPGK